MLFLEKGESVNTSVKKIIYFLLSILFLVITFDSLFYQQHRNEKIFRKIKGRVNKAFSADLPHPMLVIFPEEAISYVDVYYKIQEHSATHFWLVGNDFNPSVILNYYVYPRELRMSVSTQQMLMAKMLGKSKEPVEHFPPRKFEKIIVIKDEHAEVVDEWAGNR